ncbi:MAG: DNA gyrase/topoisomerase IV subunit A [Saprospiraceae bacterium]|nr:DNA gyrase/topoisomerase IV subunit A [Saprospiraceae bacterium]
MSKGKSIKVNIESNNSVLSSMYREYFLDYASYVILERAVPAITDGLKPVQRRILHAMKEMDDGRFHKVANIIGQTMQYHPHGDAAIGDALVHLGQKNLLIETQGNWGDLRTGDSAAAPRYIEARLSKFALDVAFNPQTTDWQLSYDGRKQEPIHLPMKFPLLLAQGVEGIAVGLSTKILPHNFNELIQASIKVLQEKRFKLYPDFETGGLIDVSEYNAGARGGRVKVRARMEQVDKKTIAVRDLPYGVTTTSLIDSILKANDKGKIKIKQVTDNTAQELEILIHLGSGVSPEITMDALYAFTNCEVSISPNACVIVDEKPEFLSVEEILRRSTYKTRDYLKWELEIKRGELEEKWHNASLEKIFIENRIYREIEECESFEEVIEVIDEGLRRFVATPSDPGGKSDKRLKLKRDITEEDIVRLTEIRIKRISKFNKFKHDELIAKTIEELDEVNHHLAHLTDFTIAYFENLLKKYGEGRERKTEIAEFDTIKVKQVVATNAKLYVDRKNGFIGTGLKKEEFVCDCSDIDDIIIFRRDGVMSVHRIDDKVFVGKNIIHVDVWKKGDERTTYNMMYVSGKDGRTRAKRFHVKSITREKEYSLGKGDKNNKVHYFTANPNGEAEVVKVQLSPNCKAKKKVFDFDFGELAIKGRGAAGNIVTKYPVRKVTQLEVGKSTLGALKLWMDEASGRINTMERGNFLGAFDTGDQILVIYSDGSYEVNDVDMNAKYEAGKVVWIGKFDPDQPISALYYDGEKGYTLVKRFEIETSTLDQKFDFLTDHRSTKLYYATADERPVVEYSYKAKNKKQVGILDFADFIDVKGWKALGNKLMDYKVLSVNPVHKEKETSDKKEKKDAGSSKKVSKSEGKSDKKVNPGDVIDFDIDNGQTELF